MALDAVLPDLSGMLVGGAAARPDSLTGFRSEFTNAFQTMLAKAPESVRNELKITSGFRSPEVQAQLWKDALKKYGSVEKARKHVAPPGKSKHGEGVAADLHYASDATKQWVRNNAKSYGLAFPLQHEPWHMELASARKRDISATPAPAGDIAGSAGSDTMVGAGGEQPPISMPFGVKTRAPSQTEIEFFNRSGIPGYASDDGFVVLSPSPPNGVNMEAIAKNEAARVFMRKNPKYAPRFDLTSEQRAFLDSTSYANATDEERAATIAARLFSGDPSAGSPTPEQEEFIKQLRGADMGSSDGGEVDYTAPAVVQSVYDGYQSGKMTPEQESEYIRDVLNGDMQAPGPLRVPDGIWKAYSEGKMDDEQRAGFEADVNAGKWARPSNESGSLVGSIWDAITGEDRAVASTEALPDWGGMPEMNDFTSENWWSSAKTALGTMFTSPEETVKVIKAQFPGVEVRQDAPGTYILKSSIDGKEYAIKPGLRASDAPRIAGGVAAFMPAGKAATMLGRAGYAMATEGAIQGSQEATGGDFDVADLLLAPATEIGFGIGSKVVKSAGSAARKALGGGTQAAKVAGGAAVDVLTDAQIGELVRKASGEGRGSKAAVAALAQQAKINPKAVAAAKDVGIELPVDALIDDTQVKKMIGLSRSNVESESAAEIEDITKKAITDANQSLKRIGAIINEDGPDIATASMRVHETLNKTQSRLINYAGKKFDQVRGAIGNDYPVTPKNLSEHMDKMLSGVEVPESISTNWPGAGIERVVPDASNLPPTLRDVYEKVRAGKSITYETLDKLRKQIGEGYSGRGPFATSSTREMDMLYAALAKDQSDAAARYGGEALRETYKAANAATQTYKQIQKDIVDTFGKDLNGSIATVLKSAAKRASGGEYGPLVRIMDVVPKNLQKEALATGIAAAMQTPYDAKMGFGFSQFGKFYTGLKQNQPVYKKVMSILGNDNKQFMDNLADVSLRLTEARRNVIKTGQANQDALQALTAQGFLASILNSTMVGRGAQRIGGMIGGGVAGGLAGGGFGAGAGMAMADVMTKLAQKSASSDGIIAAGKLFASDAFKDGIEQLVKDPGAKMSDKALRRIVRGAAYRRWAKAINNETAISKPERFLISLIQDARTRAKEDQ